MTLPEAELAHFINGHLVNSLGELAGSPANEWAWRLSDLCDALWARGRTDELLPAVVRASAVIQQFLLELATRPSGGYPVDLVVQKAAWVLNGELPTQRRVS